MARAAQQPGGVGSPRDDGNGPVMGCGIGERDMGWEGTPKAPSNSPVDWETSRHAVVNHGPTMGNLTTGSQENALKSWMAVRCPQR